MKNIFYIFLFTNYLLLSQVTEEWVKRYNDLENNTEDARAMALDNSGNIYITGSNGDYLTIKYNTSGVLQWVQSYNGPGDNSDYAHSITVDKIGNIYITGYSRSGQSYGSEDYTTIKYNSSSVQQWVQRYDGPGNSFYDYDDNARSVAVDDSGNVYITGGSYGINTNEDFATIKYNSSGVQQWVQRYNGPGNSTDFAYKVILDNLGNVYVTGLSNGSSSGNDYATIKYNSVGTQIWIQRYDGPASGFDEVHSIALDDFGNVYVTGASTAFGINTDYATIKYNSSGVQQWVQRYNGLGNSSDYAYAISVDHLGDVYITGASFTNWQNRHDYTTIKYNSSGVQQWVQSYNGPGSNDDFPYSISVDELCNIYITGYSDGFEEDYATIKYNSSGVQQWVQRYNGLDNDNDYAREVLVDSIGNVYVTGTSSLSHPDIATIKYSQLISIQTISSQVSDNFSLSQNYPNPFNPSTTIKFEIPKSSYVQILVYDILGREVQQLLNEEKKPGSYEITWDGSSFASGLYFYKLMTDDYIETKKMVLIK